MIADRLTDAWQKLKQAGRGTIDDWISLTDAASRERFIQKIMKEDQVSEAEAWRLIREDPKYSMGFKMCSPVVVTSLATKKGRAEFRECLTPEEQEIWDTEVDGKIDFKSAIKAEKKRQKREKWKRHLTVGNGQF